MCNAYTAFLMSRHRFASCAELTRTTQVLHQAAQDQTLSVRVAVLAAVANLTDTVKQQQTQLQSNLLPILAQLSSGNNSAAYTTGQSKIGLLMRTCYWTSRTSCYDHYRQLLLCLLH